MPKTRKPSISKKLVENSISAIFSAIEIHNKPVFQYRYETTVILLINARELLLKWYIYKYDRKVKLREKKDWRKNPKPFLDCVSFVKTKLWKKYSHRFANIEKIYEYRCNYIHYYWEDLDSLMFLMISENIKFYVKFIQEFFPNIKLPDENLIILPLWLKPVISAVDILSNLDKSKDASKDVKEFIKSIINTSIELWEEWNDNGIFSQYWIKLYNEKSTSNAEITAKRTQWDWVKIDNSKKIRIITAWNWTDIWSEKVRFGTFSEEKEYQNQFFPYTYRDLIVEIWKKFPYKNRYDIRDKIKKYKNNQEYAFVCKWETQIKYNEKLVDIIWKSFPDNPRLEHLKPKD